MNINKRILLASILGVGLGSAQPPAICAPDTADVKAYRLLIKAGEVRQKNPSDASAKKLASDAHLLLETLPVLSDERLKHLVFLEEFYISSKDLNNSAKVGRELDKNVDDAIKSGSITNDQLHNCLKMLRQRASNDMQRNAHLIGRGLPPDAYTRISYMYKRMQLVLDKIPSTDLNKVQYMREIFDFYKNNGKIAEAQSTQEKIDATLKAGWAEREKVTKKKKPCLGCGMG